MKEYKNNSAWVVEEFTLWIDSSITSVKEQYERVDKDSSEHTRLMEKYDTLKIVKQKIDEFKND